MPDRKFTAAELRFLRAVAAGKVERAPGPRGVRYWRYDGGGMPRDAATYFRRLSPTYVESPGNQRGSGAVRITAGGEAVLAAHPEES
ncbi:hypothetical protein ABT369_39625 [Dactylosporangium sp. NPDC000244]|uniref:hypothetical protein n=1 Tax=Dactylosporangium sp. NPDC000244 TaxID=3154365 RepID=UPI00331C3226